MFYVNKHSGILPASSPETLGKPVGSTDLGRLENVEREFVSDGSEKRAHIFRTVMICLPDLI